MRSRFDLIAAAAGLAALTSGCAGGGVVEMNCAVASAGNLSDCRVVSERPPGQGYADAALRDAQTARLSEATMRNPSATGRVNFVVRYRTPDAPATLE